MTFNMNSNIVRSRKTNKMKSPLLNVTRLVSRIVPQEKFPVAATIRQKLTNSVLIITSALTRMVLTPVSCTKSLTTRRNSSSSSRVIVRPERSSTHSLNSYCKRRTSTNSCLMLKSTRSRSNPKLNKVQIFCWNYTKILRPVNSMLILQEEEKNLTKMSSNITMIRFMRTSRPMI